jgi:5-methylcytosine-specific restriction endonuclease McrA
MRSCSGAGCLHVVPDDVRLSDECKLVVTTPDDIRVHTFTDRERYAFLYSGPRWQRTRVQVIKACPLCARCELRISEIADHIVPAGVVIEQVRASGLYRADKYAGFYFRSNLQGLCRNCHYIKTEEDKTHVGPWDNALTAELNRANRRYSF